MRQWNGWVLALGLSMACTAQADQAAESLAATCANCHGTQGRAVGGMGVLAGRPQAELLAAMQAFKAGTRPATVMHQLAKGYTDAQLTQLAAFFAQQARP